MIKIWSTDPLHKRKSVRFLLKNDTIWTFWYALVNIFQVWLFLRVTNQCYIKIYIVWNDLKIFYHIHWYSILILHFIIRVYCIDNLYALSTHLLFCRPISPLKNDKFVCLLACITCYLLKNTYSIQIIEESELSDCNTNRWAV